MQLILMLTVVGTIAITIGLIGLYSSVVIRLNKIEKDMKKRSRKHDRLEGRVYVLEQRDRDEADHIIIKHEWDEASGIRYPSQEV